jgi:ABC-type amino acid transport substrate-binding protein
MLLRSGYCDIVIGGVAITTERARHMQLSSSYLQETLGFVVRDDRRAEFESWDAIRAQRRLMVAVPAVPYFVDVMRSRLPDAHVVPVTTADGVFGSEAKEVGAILMPAERGSAWTLRYPRYTVIVPGPDQIKVPLTYVLPADEPQLRALVDTFIDLKRNDGTIQRLYEYWILGRDASAAPPRWSIIRDVLHWVE